MENEPVKNCHFTPCAYQHLAEGLNRSLSAFNSFVREDLDIGVKADRCAHYVDDIGIAALTAGELVQNFELVLQRKKIANVNKKIENCKRKHRIIENLSICRFWVLSVYRSPKNSNNVC